MPSLRTSLWITLAMLLNAPSVGAVTVPVGNLDTPPRIDGHALEWDSIPETRVPLFRNRPDGKTNIPSVSVRSAIHGDRVYFCISWEDASEDVQHKPFEWDTAKSKYVAGPQREDRLAVQFAMSGNYDSDWLSGSEFVADTWHWKAARTNPLGLAHDKQTIIQRSPMKRAYKAKASDGSEIYIQRPSDAGDKLYSTKRYASKESDSMPKYVINTQAKGSVTDVQAKGAWQDGKWTLEFSRLLDTGNSDDRAFRVGDSVTGGIAVFDHSGDDDHSYSKTIVFQF